MRSPVRIVSFDVLRPVPEWQADATSWRTRILKLMYSDRASEHFDQVFQTRFILFSTGVNTEDVSSSAHIASDNLFVSVWQIGQNVEANTHRLSRNLPVFIYCLFIDPLSFPGYVGLGVQNGDGQ